MTETTPRPAAVTIEALDAHLYHLQRSLEGVATAVGTMAKREDIEAIGRRLDQFATKAQLGELEEKVSVHSAAKAFDRMLSLITRIGAAAAVILASVGAGVMLVHFVDRLPK